MTIVESDDDEDDSSGAESDAGNPTDRLDAQEVDASIVFVGYY